jgi:4-diphosphocytidyl-2-C-methyl-D-erythritol kinase
MITLKAPAKVNLFLAIRGKDPSGFHEIETVLARVPELADTIQIEPAETLEIRFLPDSGIDPSKNTLTKALELLEERTGEAFHYKITVHKNIPPRSGLGGGASDAASLMLHLNHRRKLGLTQKELLDLGAQIGMDVPFFISGAETALGTHYGERITPLNPLPKNLKIDIEPRLKIMSTQDAYALWDARQKTLESMPSTPSAKPCLAALQNGYAPGILQAAYNDFERIFPMDFGSTNENEAHVSRQKILLAGSGASRVRLSLN